MSLERVKKSLSSLQFVLDYELSFMSKAFCSLRQETLSFVFSSGQADLHVSYIIGTKI